MSFTELERHTFENGDSISVGRNSKGDYSVAFDGPARLESVICFNRVDVSQRRIVLCAKTAEGRTIKTGSLEGSPQTYGSVGAWLDQYAEDPHAFEGVPV